MASNGKKVIAVLGATGSQGGAIVRHFLSAPLAETWTVRALTRDPSKPRGLALASQGAQVVAADMNSPSSLRDAFAGAHVVFAVTDFFDTANVDDEVRVGRNVVDALVAVGGHTLQQFVFSGLPELRAGKAASTLAHTVEDCLHFNGKNDVVAYLRGTRLWEKSTVVYIAAFFQNFIKFPDAFGPAKEGNGEFVLHLNIKPTTTLGFVDIDNLGLLLEQLVAAPEKYHKRTLSFYTCRLTGPEILEKWGQALGVKARFNELTDTEYRRRLTEGHGWPEFLARDMADMWEAVRENGYENVWSTAPAPGEEVINGGELIENATSFETFARNADWSHYTKQ